MNPDSSVTSGAVRRAHYNGTRILFLPRPESSRTSERTPTLFRLMGARHPLLGLPGPWDPVIYDPSRARTPRLLLYVLDKLLLVLRGVVAGHRFRATVVFCETVHHAVAGLAIARILGVPCVWDSHGNGKLFYESMGKGRWQTRLVAALEAFLGNRVDRLITVSEVDATAYAAMGLPRDKITVIPVCVSLREIDAQASDEFPTNDPGRPVLLLFGSFRYEPNRDALEFVNTTLAPQLEERGVSCDIEIAGRDIPSAKFHPSVRVLGFVPDIHARIRAATLCIVPVRKGVGVLTKVIDSMAVGTPLVLSDFAARGIPELHHGVHAFVASTDADFVRRVMEALSNPKATRAMSRRARRLVEEKFDWGSYSDALDAVLDGSPTRGREADAYAH